MTWCILLKDQMSHGRRFITDRIARIRVDELFDGGFVLVSYKDAYPILSEPRHNAIMRGGTFESRGCLTIDEPHSSNSVQTHMNNMYSSPTAIWCGNTHIDQSHRTNDEDLSDNRAGTRVWILL